MRTISLTLDEVLKRKLTYSDLKLLSSLFSQAEIAGEGDYFSPYEVEVLLSRDGYPRKVLIHPQNAAQDTAQGYIHPTYMQATSEEKYAYSRRKVENEIKRHRLPFIWKQVGLALSGIALVLIVGGVLSLNVSRPTPKPTPKITTVKVKPKVSPTITQKVPDVRGVLKDRASLILQTSPGGENVSIEIKEEPSELYEEGTVIDQDPKPGAVWGSKITLKVSSGTGKVYPELVGMTLDQANELLKPYEVMMQTKEEYSSRPQGEILSSSIPKGSPIKRGSTIDLRVASGMNIVPEIALLTQDEAKQRLGASGFTPSFVAQDVTDENLVGKVLPTWNKPQVAPLAQQLQVPVGGKVAQMPPSLPPSFSNQYNLQ